MMIEQGCDEVSVDGSIEGRGGGREKVGLDMGLGE